MRGLAAGDVDPADQQHQHPVDAVAVHALRGRPAVLARARLDAELVDLDMPGGGPQRRRGQPVEQARGRCARIARSAGWPADRVGHRLEPALDAAVQRVVVAALVMRLVRLAHDPRRRWRGSGEAAAAVAPAIGHEHVDAEIVPARGKRPPVAQPGRLQQRRISGARTKAKPSRATAAASGASNSVIGDRLSHLSPALAEPEHAGAGRAALTVPGPRPAFCLPPVQSQSGAEGRDQHRAHSVGAPRDRIGLGVDQERLAEPVPCERDLLAVGLKTLGPEIARVPGPAELRVDDRDRRVAKLGVDRAPARSIAASAPSRCCPTRYASARPSARSS